jgi:hypothetical protein
MEGDIAPSQPTEVKMQKALTIVGALLIAGSAVQVASASENHPRKVHRAAAVVQDQSNFHGAYNGPRAAAFVQDQREGSNGPY